MYKVSIFNDEYPITIHSPIISSKKLKAGQIVEGINTIDTFTFSIYKNNVGFDLLNDYVTEIRIKNTLKNIDIFDGRVLRSKKSMDSDGKIFKEVTCESCLGYLCDSKQPYVEEKNWELMELLNHLKNNHNSQLEEKKHFQWRNVSIIAPNNNLYMGIQRENTFECIKKIIDKIGGEIKMFRVDGKLVLDYVPKFGSNQLTSITVKKNMKSIDKDSDPSSFITKLIPLGAKKKIIEIDANGNSVEKEIEDRIDITEINDGKNYILDEEGVERYGIIVGYQYWDDVTEPYNLLNKAKNFMLENNKVSIKWSVSALDLYIIGKAPTDFEVGNSYPVKNYLLDIEENLRVIKKTTDIINFTSTSIEFGDTVKTLSEIQIDNNNNIRYDIEVIKKDYVKNKDIASLIDQRIGSSSLIEQLTDKITLKVQKFTWIRYADDVNGTGMSDDSENKKYIGIATNQESKEPSSDPTLYKWSKIQGEDGTPGINGKDAAVQSDVEPIDKTQMWLDTNTNQLKVYDGDNWIVVNDFSDDLDIIGGTVEKITEQVATLEQASDKIKITVSETENIVKNLNGSVSTMQGTITQMSSSFTTKGLGINKLGDEFSSTLDNKGLKIYNLSRLIAIFNKNGSGMKKVIATESIQLQNLLLKKGTKQTQRHGNISVIQGFWQDNLIETLEDLEVDTIGTNR